MADHAAAAVLLALTTEADQQRAEALARELLQRRLVACVSLQPVQSLYLWEGQLQTSPEVQLLLKTGAAQVAALAAAVQQLHSYDTPQWLVWPAEASTTYGAWLAEVLPGA